MPRLGSLVRIQFAAQFAIIAQLVEHRPSKSEVAGSSPVYRSNGSLVELVTISHCHCEGHGFDSHTNRKLEVSQYAFQSN